MYICSKRNVRHVSTSRAKCTTVSRARVLVCPDSRGPGVQKAIVHLQPRWTMQVIRRDGIDAAPIPLASRRRGAVTSPPPRHPVYTAKRATPMHLCDTPMPIWERDSSR